MSLLLDEDQTRVACPFCRIAHGLDQDAAIVARRESWVAFFPKEPAALGHTLIIPRVHVPHFWALPADLAGVLANAAIEVGAAVQLALDPGGLNLITSAGADAEQTIPHVHLHVVPRAENDALDPIWPAADPAVSSGALRGLATDLRTRLANPAG